jgi:plasmid stabilization system protein ParE
MDYKVIWDEEAIAELSQAVRFIARKNPDAARKTGETILQKAGMLGPFPRLGKVYSRLNREDVREIPIPPYRIIYHVKDAECSVRIMKVWHGARQEPEISVNP